jgi:hypothetical protein
MKTFFGVASDRHVHEIPAEIAILIIFKWITRRTT